MSNLERLLHPASLAVVGGGAWARAVIAQCRSFGFSGRLHVVHPKADEIDGILPVRTVADLPEAPDAVFVGVNRHTAIEVIGALAAMGAGGAIVFASGFSEAVAEDASGGDLQAALVEAAGEMPILGPNCYGFINALDRVPVWPDQHGCEPVERGVAILTQSSNIAINLTMQQRGLPIAFMVTCGNMAQTSQARLAMALLEDPRITALGLHVEGFGDPAEWHALARKAWELGKPIVVLKVGRSAAAQAATVSHTASLAGSDAGAQGLLDHLGLGRAFDVPTFLETLKLLHFAGPLEAPTLSSISCSGGEASLAADTAEATRLRFPPLTEAQHAALAEALGPMVALANPLDYHTYIWRDTAAMTAAWQPMAAAHIGLTISVVDYPTTDAGDWACATEAALAVRAATGRPFAVVATMPELMPPDVAATLAAGGVVPLQGLSEAIAAADIAAHLRAPKEGVPFGAGPERVTHVITEGRAKAMLAAAGVQVPHSVSGAAAEIDARGLTAPFAVKGMGLAHKSEHGAVRLNVGHDGLAEALTGIGTHEVLVEEMVTGAVAEVLVGVLRDPAHGFVLTLGAGGVLTELWQDTQSLLLPASRADMEHALQSLRIGPLLAGYRGKPGADMEALLDTLEALTSFITEHAGTLDEVEINPLIVTPTTAIAADALIRMAPSEKGS
ncbi:MAG: acetate--CoA ligase family protein [Rhodobacteraceae bacterium]|nr:acetate--CoA ligase family protein [Paracoccaceae bacterium]